jgi:hypothetical protein
MTGTPTAVVRIDLRASAVGPCAMDAAAVGADTLGELQDALRGTHAGAWLFDAGRVLVFDDTTAFTRHESAYHHLVSASTIGKLLCVAVGSCGDRTAIGQPAATRSPNAAVLWIGDPRGVGWRPGMTTTTALGVTAGDSEGTTRLDGLIGLLAEHEVFDRVFAAIADLPGRLGAPAILPAVRWPARGLLALNLVAAQEPAPQPPPDSADVVELLGYPDLRPVLVALWSFGPAVARSERLLADAEEAARRLSRFPGIGGRRAWCRAVEAGDACARLGPAGPPWPAPAFPPDIAARLCDPPAASMWHPASALLALLACGSALLALVPPWEAALAGWAATLAVTALLAVALPGPPRPSPRWWTRVSWRTAALAAAVTAADAAAAAAAAAANPLGRLDIPQAASDGLSAGLGVLVLIVTAVTWWRRTARGWREALPFPAAHAALTAMPEAVAANGVSWLHEAADRWHRAQRHRLAAWWLASRRGLRAVLLREVAVLFGPEPSKAQPATSAPPALAMTPDLTATVHEAIARAAKTMSTGPEDEAFLQLTGPEELALLDGTIHFARLVAFAPSAAREQLARALPDGTTLRQVAWTAAGETAGLIRLVPLRASALRDAAPAAPGGGTQVAIDVAANGGPKSLADWLASDDDLAAHVSGPGDGDAPVTVAIPDSDIARALAHEVVAWLRASGSVNVPAALRFTRGAGRAAMVASMSSSDTSALTDPEGDALAARLANFFLGDPWPLP